MPDTGSNITIDISGNTAEMATDFASSGVNVTGAHVPIQKLAFGDSTVSKRVSSSNPLPITIQSYQSNVGISGDVGISGNAIVFNAFETDPTGVTNNWLKVAGSVTGGDIGITGTIQGIAGGYPIGVTGTVAIDEQTGIPVHGISGQDGFTGTAAPLLATGGRRLTSATDTVTVTGTVNATGGRNILAATDSIKVFGNDGDKFIPAILYRSTAGATAGFSGDALKVSIVDASIAITASVQTVHGVTNDSVDNALRIQGLTGAEPVLIKGENGGAVPITTSSAITVTQSGTVTIDDTNITTSLESSSKPIVSNLTSIKSNTNSIPGIRTDLASGNVQVKVLESVQPSALSAGSRSTNTTASQLVTNVEVKSGVSIKSSVDNTDTILVGSYTLTQGDRNGYPLEPGESCFLNVNNVGLVYCKSVRGTQTVHYLGS